MYIATDFSKGTSFEPDDSQQPTVFLIDNKLHQHQQYRTTCSVNYTLITFMKPSRLYIGACVLDHFYVDHQRRQLSTSLSEYAWGVSSALRNQSDISDEITQEMRNRAFNMVDKEYRNTLQRQKWHSRRVLATYNNIKTLFNLVFISAAA